MRKLDLYLAIKVYALVSRGAQVFADTSIVQLIKCLILYSKGAFTLGAKRRLPTFASGRFRPLLKIGQPLYNS